MTNQMVRRNAFLGGVLAVAVLCVPVADALAQDAGFSLSDVPDSGVILHLPAADVAKIDPSALATNGQRLVLTLAASASQRDALRQTASGAGLAGLVTVIEQTSLQQLPMASWYVNALVVEDPVDAQKRGLTWTESVRVVAPGGWLLIRGGLVEAMAQELKRTGCAERAQVMDTRDGWLRIRGLALPGMGEWRMPNAADTGGREVAPDRFNPRRNPHGRTYISWVDDKPGSLEAAREPIWLRWLDGIHHSGSKGFSRGVVAAEGVVIGLFGGSGETFSSIRDGSVFERKRGQSQLVCRDAFNGTLRWVRPQTGKLCGVDDGRVFLLEDGQLHAYSVLDGHEIYKLAAPAVEPISEMRAANALVLAGTGRTPWVAAHAPDDGRQIWKRNLPWTTLVVEDGHIILGYTPPKSTATNAPDIIRFGVSRPNSIGALAALDMKTGDEQWRYEGQDWPTNSDVRLRCAGEGVVLVEMYRRVDVLDIKTGQRRYQEPAIPDPKIPQWGVFVNLLPGRKLLVSDSTTRVLDLETGDMRKVHDARVGPPNDTVAAWCCGPGRMTAGMYLGLPMGTTNAPTPAEIGTLGTEGTCGAGPAIAYHSVYMPGQGCACGDGWGRMKGFVVAGRIDSPLLAEAFRQTGPMEKGPSFDRAAGPKGAPTNSWTMARGNPMRSAAAQATLRENLQTRWTSRAIPLGIGTTVTARYVWRGNFLYSTTLTAPVVGDGKVVYATPMSHRVVALDADSGRSVWQFEADGPIDSAPALVRGRCVFGCRDGYLYSLDLKDGTLAWRRRLSPIPQRINVYGQLEDRFPVVGAVLPDKDGNVWATAGLNGQQYVIAANVDAVSGEVRVFRFLPRSPYGNDMLVHDDAGNVWLNYQPVEPLAPPRVQYRSMLVMHSKLKHLIQPDSELISPVRVVTPYGAARYGNFGFWNKGTPAEQQRMEKIAHTEMLYRMVPAVFLAWDAQRVVGVHPLYRPSNSSPKDYWPPVEAGRVYAMARDKVESGAVAESVVWQQDLGDIWALAIAGDKVLAGGPVYPDTPPAAVEPPSILGRPTDKPVSIDPLCAKGRLSSLGVSDGRRVATIDLPASPVHDGVAIAGGKVFVACADGSVVCVE